MARILHVTEGMGGGTSAAVVEFARSTPQPEHHLLFQRRSRGELVFRHDFAGCRDAGRRLLPQVRLAQALRAAVTRLRPQIVHLHSTWAGLVGRAVLPRGAGGPAVLYTPHCFGFERVVAGRLLQAAERVMADRTDLAVCVSPHEQLLAAGLGLPTVLVPNTTRGRPQRSRPSATGDSVVTVGRIGPQKDPGFLLRVKALCGRRAAWTWIGAGDRMMEAGLRRAGVTVTGWLPPGEVRARLAGADVYLHTAAWESCPLPLLEAAAAGLPIVARSIPALDLLGLDPSLGTAEAVAEELSAVLATGRPTRPRLQQTFAAAHTPQAQVAALTAAYVSVLYPIAVGVG